MTKQTYAILTLLLLTTGCASTKEWQATGGSRADGVVVLSYTHSNYEMPSTDDAQGLSIAQVRCASWGYISAEAFGGEIKKCSSPSYSGCVFWQVDKTYQCTGRPEK